MGRKTPETPAATEPERFTADQFLSMLWQQLKDGGVGALRSDDGDLVVMTKATCDTAIAKAHAEGHDCQEDYLIARANVDGLAEIEMHDGTVLTVAERDAIDMSVRMLVLAVQARRRR